MSWVQACSGQEERVRRAVCQRLQACLGLQVDVGLPCQQLQAPVLALITV